MSFRLLSDRNDIGKPNIHNTSDESSLSFDLLPNDLLSAWKFSNGALLADSIGSATLTNTGSVASNSNGKDGYCASFNGSDYFTFSETNEQTSYIAVSCWVKPSSVANEHIFSLESATNKYCLDIRISTIVYLYINNTACTFFTATGTKTLSTGQWYHIFAVFNKDDRGYLYINGDLDATGDEFSGTVCTSAQYALGARAEDGAGKLNGLLDEVYYWKKSSPIFETREEQDLFAKGIYNNGVGRYI